MLAHLIVDQGDRAIRVTCLVSRLPVDYWPRILRFKKKGVCAMIEGNMIRPLDWFIMVIYSRLQIVGKKEKRGEKKSFGIERSTSSCRVPNQ